MLGAARCSNSEAFAASRPSRSFPGVQLRRRSPRGDLVHGASGTGARQPVSLRDGSRCVVSAGSPRGNILKRVRGGTDASASSTVACRPSLRPAPRACSPVARTSPRKERLAPAPQTPRSEPRSPRGIQTEPRLLASSLASPRRRQQPVAPRRNLLESCTAPCTPRHLAVASSPEALPRLERARGRPIQWTPTLADEPGFFFPFCMAESREPSQGSQGSEQGAEFSYADNSFGCLPRESNSSIVWMQGDMRRENCAPIVRKLLLRDEEDGCALMPSMEITHDNTEEIADAALEKSIDLLRSLKSLDIDQQDVRPLRCQISSNSSDATLTTCPEPWTMLSEPSVCRSEPALSSQGSIAVDAAPSEGEAPFHSGMHGLVATLEQRVLSLEERLDFLTRV